METLRSSLERFNRKERNLLVRAVLGHVEGKPLELSGDFRKDVAEKLGGKGAPPIPTDAWWATDYHIAWLAGALAVYVEGEKQAVAKKARLDQLYPPQNDRRIAEGDQQDIDLVIVSGVDLILIEVKGASYFDNKQLASKMERLDLVHSHYEQWIKDALPSAPPKVNFHFLLMSPQRPTEKLKVKWPVWLSPPRDQWLELTFPKDALTVSRCDDKGNPTKDGPFWCIVEA